MTVLTDRTNDDYYYSYIAYVLIITNTPYRIIMYAALPSLLCSAPLLTLLCAAVCCCALLCAAVVLMLSYSGHWNRSSEMATFMSFTPPHNVT